VGTVLRVYCFVCTACYHSVLSWDSVFGQGGGREGAREGARGSLQQHCDLGRALALHSIPEDRCLVCVAACVDTLSTCSTPTDSAHVVTSWVLRACLRGHMPCWQAHGVWYIPRLCSSTLPRTVVFCEWSAMVTAAVFTGRLPGGLLCEVVVGPDQPRQQQVM
jgi:hypothetical protein